MAMERAAGRLKPYLGDLRVPMDPSTKALSAMSLSAKPSIGDEIRENGDRQMRQDVACGHHDPGGLQCPHDEAAGAASPNFGHAPSAPRFRCPTIIRWWF